MKTEFQIAYSGLCIGFTADFPMAVPEELKPFLCEGLTPAEHYHIQRLPTHLQTEGALLYGGHDFSAYKEDGSTLLVFHNRGGCACRICASGAHQLYVTQKLEQILETGSRIASLLNGEEILLKHDGMLLHSSLVCHEGQGVLFSGPCGIGKSTQAALWNQSFGDKIINGDRAAVRLFSDGVYAGGSPWCGSSGIYCPDFVPVQALILLRQGPVNHMALAEPKVAFREIYSQCVVHSWDRAFVDRLCTLISTLLQRVPVYTLTCVPEASAAALAKEILFP